MSPLMYQNQQNVTFSNDNEAKLISIMIFCLGVMHSVQNDFTLFMFPQFKFKNIHDNGHREWNTGPLD